MALKKIKIGDLIQTIDERNTFGIKDFFGVNIEKEFMPTAANTEGLNEKNYKVMRKNRFVFSGMQTGRDNCIRISLYQSNEPIIVSPAYITFEVSIPDLILPEYLFMFFLSKEKDRLGAFYSDGSIRSNLDWDRFCDIEIELPNIEIQQKYVDVYLAMIENQKAYELGLEDLKLTCDAYLEDLRKMIPSEEIGKYIELTRFKNDDSLVKKVLGISKDGFIDPKQDPGDLINYFIFEYNDFVYSPPRINVGSIGLYKGKGKAVCSPIYVTFRVIDNEKLLPDYLMMWFKRDEFLRLTDFKSIATVRNNFSYDLMEEVEIPIPSIKIQKSIANIYKCYEDRKEINEKLKNRIKDMCPILIKGSIEEARNS